MAKTNSEKILATLKGRKRGLTALQIADKTGLKAGSTRTALYELSQSGQVERTTAPAAGRGRPAYLYVTA